MRAETRRVKCACQSCTRHVKCACDLCVVWVCRLWKYLYVLLRVRTVRKYPYVLQCKVRILVSSHTLSLTPPLSVLPSPSISQLYTNSVISLAIRQQLHHHRFRIPDFVPSCTPSCAPLDLATSRSEQCHHRSICQLRFLPNARPFVARAV